MHQIRYKIGQICKSLRKAKFSKFWAFANSKHIFFRILYFPYSDKIVFCKARNIIQNMPNPCFLPKNKWYWPKNHVFRISCIYGISENGRFPHLRNILRENWIISFAKKLFRLEYSSLWSVCRALQICQPNSNEAKNIWNSFEFGKPNSLFKFVFGPKLIQKSKFVRAYSQLRKNQNCDKSWESMTEVWKVHVKLKKCDKSWERWTKIGKVCQKLKKCANKLQIKIYISVI